MACGVVTGASRCDDSNAGNGRLINEQVRWSSDSVRMPGIEAPEAPNTTSTRTGRHNGYLLLESAVPAVMLRHPLSAIDDTLSLQD